MTAELIAAARAGDRAALARLLSVVERGGDGAREVGRALHGTEHRDGQCDGSIRHREARPSNRGRVGGGAD